MNSEDKADVIKYAVFVSGLVSVMALWFVHKIVCVYNGVAP